MPEPGTSGVDGRITVVVRTRGDAAVPAQCLERLAALPERPAIVVVDATACRRMRRSARSPRGCSSDPTTGPMRAANPWPRARCRAATGRARR